MWRERECGNDILCQGSEKVGNIGEKKCNILYGKNDNVSFLEREAFRGIAEISMS